MPRLARLDAPGVLHHIMIRGIERRNIFKNNKDREDLIWKGTLGKNKFLFDLLYFFTRVPLPHGRQLHCAQLPPVSLVVTKRNE